ncbi:calcium-dependent protein kinase 28-like isoform X1 [Cornus florida]|uniref:calcium-dependent protein kinase 28-like isoform X1 n=1 Tax=Cornus florida TaxID=4283 RepID=UPI0028985369|nr:calcium-dependent protein kinase 28-like isoform X1 [Cornus florida]
MGICFSRTRVGGSNSNNNVKHNRKDNTKPATTTTSKKRDRKSRQKSKNTQETNKNHQQKQRNPQQVRPREKGNSRLRSGVIPCGKRTDFGFAKDFDRKYSIGKLLGHGQFGYTYVAIDKSNGDRVAVKRIEKNKLTGFKKELLSGALALLMWLGLSIVFHPQPCKSGCILMHTMFQIPILVVNMTVGIIDTIKMESAVECMVLPVAVEDVKREVKILHALAGHENVVHFYNAFEDDSYVYIVMELCEGGELLDRILGKKDSRYTEKDAAIVVRQMLKVAAECHLHGLVHRDMKPENFLFKSPKVDSPLKATDFGLSDFIRPGKKFRDIVGSAYYVAPEVLKRKSGPESDVWSIGVITYILLCGRRPFWDKTEDGIFKEVLRNKPDFRRKPWPNISSSAKDFVTKLLVKDPRARLTAAQALSHAWVREGGNASEIPLDISVLSNMRQFVKYSRLKQFALRALATTLDDEELADLHDQFDAIDVDKSGTISLEEMRQALAKDLPWKLKDSRVLEILQAIDSNTDGLVDFPEFVAATLHVNQLEEHDTEKWLQRSQAAFEKFDVDRDGYITPEELRMHTGLKGSLDPLLEEADIDRDGKISLPEFRRLLRTASLNSPRKVPSPHAHQAFR